MAVAFIVNHPQNLTRIYLEKIGENQMLMKRMTRVMVWVLCVWLLTALMGESAIFNHSPRPALAKFPGADIVTNNALNDTGASVVTTIPLADFSADATEGLAPLQVQFSNESTRNPTGWTWYDDEAYTEPWTQMAGETPWTPRRDPTSVVLPDCSIVMMGGQDDSYRVKNDVWRSTDQGATWTQVTAAAGWTPRDGHSSVALADGSIVLMGGWDDSGQRNDVWRSIDQGATWTQMTAAAPWTPRRAHTSVALADGSIVLMGASIPSDVWRSTDQGATWTQMTAEAPWAARAFHTSVALVDGSIVLMGGWDAPGKMNDVWRSADQGATWMQMTAAAPWTPREEHSSVALADGSIVLMGGTDDSGRTNDGWRSTDQGATWTQMTADAGWTPRSDHTSVAMADGNIVLMGGDDGSRRNDVWRSTDQGATWTQMTAAAEWTARSRHSSVVLEDGSIVLMGGHDGSYQNDVWRSTDQGVTWTEMTPAAEWTARRNHTSVVLPDGSILLMGGYVGWEGGYRNDVWRSNDQGKSWIQLTDAAEWTGRSSHNSVVLPDGSIVLMGGYDGSFLSDVWCSIDQGATWTKKTGFASWAEARNHTSVALPDGSIILMDGDGYARVGNLLKNVWRSTNQGALWWHMENGGWERRSSYTSVALTDGSIVLMGGFTGLLIRPRLNDVWRLETAGSNEQHPVHIYTNPGDYSVVLQVYNDEGVSSTRKEAYINVTDMEPVPPGFVSIYLPLLVNQAP
jgi:hypothetical protein